MPTVLHPDVWRGWQGRRDAPAVSTGHPGLDQVLPGGGWPVGALTELLASRPGLGELSLLLPMLAATTASGHSVLLVDPPWAPYPPAMCGHGVDLRHVMLVRTGSAGDSLWACEQALRGTHGGTVLAWPQEGTPGGGFAQLRRLQLAAHANCQAAFLFRPASVAGSASPATLRIHLEADDRQLNLTLIKGSGIRPGTTVRLHRQHGPVPPAGPRGDAAARGNRQPNRAWTADSILPAPDEPPGRGQ